MLKGLPLSVVLSGANTHDVKLLEETLNQIVTVRPLLVGAALLKRNEKAAAAEAVGCVLYPRHVVHALNH